MKYYILLVVFVLCGVIITLLWKHKIPDKSIHCDTCNVVIISLDTIRASQLPCYGYARNTMPNLCRFADRSMRFENAYAQSSWTFPNATSVMTGLYPSQHGMYDNIIDTLHPSIPSLPKLYKQAGYHTMAIINSQETNIPLPAQLLKEFDTVISTQGYPPNEEIQMWVNTLTEATKLKKPVFLYIYTTFVGYYRSTSLGIARLFPLDPSFTAPEFVSQKIITPNIRKDALWLVRTTQKNATDAASQKKYTDLLTNLSSPSQHIADGAFDMLTDDQKLFLFQEETARNLSITNADHLRYIENLYDEQLRILDSNLDSFLTLLESPRIKKNTISVIYSDHGENLGNHGLWGHATAPYSTLTHIPLIIHIPNISPTSVKRLSQMVDVFPSLLSTTNITIPIHISGKNIWPAKSTTAINSKNAYSIAQLNYGDDISIKTAQWLLMTHKEPDGKITHKLYDLENDPNEEKDVAKFHPEIIKSILSTYSSAINIPNKK